MKEALLVMLGAVLSYIATMVAEKQRFKNLEIEERKTYILRARLALQSLNNAFEKLKDGYSYKNLFEYQRIDIVDSQINDLQFLKADIEKLSPNQQEKLLVLLSDIALLAKMLRNTENFSINSRDDIGKKDGAFPTIEDHTSYFERQRTQKLIDLMEIKRRIDDFLRGI